MFNFIRKRVRKSHNKSYALVTTYSAIMDAELENKLDSIPAIEDENLKGRAKKGVSITISLVMLGFSGWKDLEPGRNYSINQMIFVSIHITVQF